MFQPASGLLTGDVIPHIPRSNLRLPILIDEDEPRPDLINFVVWLITMPDFPCFTTSHFLIPWFGLLALDSSSYSDL